MIEISLQELKNRLSTHEDDFFVLDVRTQQEWNSVSLEEDSRVHYVSLQNIPSVIDSLPKDKTCIVLCASGIRSVNACHYLHENGFNTVNVFDGVGY